MAEASRTTAILWGRPPREKYIERLNENEAFCAKVKTRSWQMQHGTERSSLRWDGFWSGDYGAHDPRKATPRGVKATTYAGATIIGAYSRWIKGGRDSGRSLKQRRQKAGKGRREHRRFSVVVRRVHMGHFFVFRRGK